MAIRSEELYPQEAAIYRFPTAGPRRHATEVRRRRLLMGLCVVVMSLVLLVATGPEGTAVASSDSAPRTVVLQPGDTLWDLAEAYAVPGSDPRAYVHALEELNDLEGVPQAGQRLRLPR